MVLWGVPWGSNGAVQLGSIKACCSSGVGGVGAAECGFSGGERGLHVFGDGVVMVVVMVW